MEKIIDTIKDGYSTLKIYNDIEDDSVICLSINSEEIWLNKEEKARIISALSG